MPHATRIRLRIHALVVLALGAGASAAAQCPVAFLEPHMWAHPNFGDAVAVRPDLLVVGAPNDDPGFATTYGPGRVYTFVSTAAGWVLDQRLDASDGQPGQLFGTALAIADTRLLIGSPSAGVGGAAYVFREDAQGWVQERKLIVAGMALDADLARAVALTDTHAFLGAPRHDTRGYQSGSVFVFERQGTQWSLVVELTAAGESTNDVFGWAVAADGDTLVVGAPGNDGAGWEAGAAYVFENTGGTWIQTAELVVPGASPRDLFGRSVAIEGDRVLVGAPAADTVGMDSGAVHAFVREPGWAYVATLLPTELEPLDHLGGVLAMDGARAVVGAIPARPGPSPPGAVYLFDWDGAAWQHASRIESVTLHYSFGEAVALAGDLIGVGLKQAQHRGRAELVAWGADLGTTYCAAVPNSTGQASALSASGSEYLAGNCLEFLVEDLPPGAFGMFVMSDTQALLPLFGGDGTLCLGLPLARFADDILAAGAAGTVVFDVDLTSLPVGAVAPAEVWNFQLWYRDHNPLLTSNFSTGLEVLLR
ncbi:MAG: hypothetical protein GY711_17960 [bacterium]|nr:hypothetical protein [bacterium]